MKTQRISGLGMFILALAGLTAACAGTTIDDTKPKTNTATGASSSEDDEDDVNDKVLCKVDGDCDSDERCEAGRCVGLDGDKD